MYDTSYYIDNGNMMYELNYESLIDCSLNMIEI